MQRSREIRFRERQGTEGLRSRQAPGSALVRGASACGAGWRVVALPWLGMLILLRFWHTCFSSSSGTPAFAAWAEIEWLTLPCASVRLKTLITCLSPAEMPMRLALHVPARSLLQHSTSPVAQGNRRSTGVRAWTFPCHTVTRSALHCHGLRDGVQQMG